MIKILNSKNKRFDFILDKLLGKRKNKVQIETVSVVKILKDVKKNGDKAVIKYEKKFNNNKTIKPNPKQINKLIKGLDKKVKKAIDLHTKEYINFTHCRNLKIFLILIVLKINWNINIYQLNQLQFMFQAQTPHIPQVY